MRPNCSIGALFVLFVPTQVFMDIQRLSGEEKLKFSRVYFLAGIVFLPFLWWINIFCFLKELSSPQSYPELKLLKKCNELYC
ncbi:hypothetical protein KSF78_0001084 [Schistosoma japonicum]|nr:hypothetical protein KSF78_0001084 [Schistosoma japonicum]